MLLSVINVQPSDGLRVHKGRAFGACHDQFVGLSATGGYET